MVHAAAHSQTKTSVQPPNWNAQEVIEMFREIGLRVCDKHELIKDSIDKRMTRWLKDKSNPDRDVARKAQLLIQNAEAMFNRRSELLEVVYHLFETLANGAIATDRHGPVLDR
jgi:hypothetical protein